MKSKRFKHGSVRGFLWSPARCPFAPNPGDETRTKVLQKKDHALQEIAWSGQAATDKVEGFATGMAGASTRIVGRRAIAVDHGASGPEA